MTDYQHEALDRTHVVSTLFDDVLVEHPYIVAHPDLKEQVDRISELLGDLYQAIGARE